METMVLNLTDRKWREFKIGALFDIELSKGDNQAKLLQEGNVPLVSAGSINNGICKYISAGDGVSKNFSRNIITIDMFGKAFYQPATFYAVSHGRVNIMIPKGVFNKWHGLFIVTALEQGGKGKYSFANMCNQSRLQRSKILLPVDNNGAPDYEFMERYIRTLTEHKRDEYRRFLNKQTNKSGCRVKNGRNSRLKILH
ncbi:MAG TPA: hypothetical protein DD611_03215 [Alphaproteobacteria bacterium]|nr:hypothetical protein [Alphaproteobacteria bacterium]